MRRFSSYLQTALHLLNSYDGGLPFALYLKMFFKANRKYGGRDRKQIAALCYGYFRAGQALKGLSMEEQILAGYFLVSNAQTELLNALRPEWNAMADKRIEAKLKVLGCSTNAFQPFPFCEELSEEIDAQAFSLAHLQQPDLFLRIRPGFMQKVKQKLTDAGIAMQEPFENCLALANETPVDRILQVNKEAVVQDFSSQRTATLVAPLLKAFPHNIKVWDCCAGSGGKSIMLYDLIPTMDLTVSDVRKTILTNLKTRFKEAGIPRYQSLVADLAKEPPPLADASFDLVVADVPCSGSGTWGRTPENLKYFQTDRIEYYRSLQQQMLRHVVPAIKKSGYLLYITCSVFREENENNVNWICTHHGMEKVEAQIIKGYAMKADTMFAALLKKI